MALRIGKKKSGDTAAPAAADASAASPAAAPAATGGADDWSDFGNIPNETSPAAAGEDWTSFDDLVDPSLDVPATAVANVDVADTALDAPATGKKGKKVKPAKISSSGTPGAKKGLPKAAIIAIPVLLLGAGAGAYLMRQSSPPVDEMPPPNANVIGPPKPGATRPKMATAPKPAPAAAKPGAVKPGAAKPGAVPVKPGAGPAAPGAAPAAAKPATGAAPAAGATPVAGKPVGKPGAPAEDVTHVAALPGQGDKVANAKALDSPAPPQSANPGITFNPHNVALAPAPGAAAKAAAAATAGMTPAQVAKRSRLKALWNDGAAAKRSGKTAEARKIWTQGLKLAEASPRMDASAAGFKGSLAKLK